MRRYLGLMFTYRGREGSWAHIFHRLSGVGVWLFVVLHVIDIWLVGAAPEEYDSLLRLYASPPGRVLEVLLGGALFYHALNGMRILIIDLWPSMTVHHRKLWWGSWIIFVALGVPGALIILRPLWKDPVDQLFSSAARIMGVM
jgi:succinate dehydrogenase / fumarate reductase cytochrome b subunit